MLKGVQMIQLGTIMGSNEKALSTMHALKDAGYDGIELNGFMIKKMPMIVNILTSMAGMPTGKTGKLDWNALMKRSPLCVTSIHEDLGSIQRDPDAIIAEAKSFGTEDVVITGMHQFDYSDAEAVKKLVNDLNESGRILKQGGINLLYHNHNCELRKVDQEHTAFDLIIDETDPEYVNFEFDSYWPTEAGADAYAIMERMGKRVKLYHICDRGTRVEGKGESIVKSQAMELGEGNMPLNKFMKLAKDNEVKAVILEQHKDWIDKDPLKSARISSEFLKKY